MADSAEDKEKAEKLAAARRRVEQLKKRGATKKKAGEGGGGGSSESKKKGTKASKTAAAAAAQETKAAHEQSEDVDSDAPFGAGGDGKAEESKTGGEGAKEAAKPEANKGEEVPPSSPPPRSTPTSPTTIPVQPQQPLSSIAAASHSRAASFSATRDSKSHLRRPSIASDVLRAGPTPSPISPSEAVPDIYRKQAQTISELTEALEKLEVEARTLREKEQQLNVLLVQKDELHDEVTELRQVVREYKSKTEEVEKSGEMRDGEVEKLKLDLATATRQISLLTSQLSQKDKTISELRSQATTGTTASSVTSTTTPPIGSSETDDLLRSKEEEIESMAMEISKLRLDLDKSSKLTTQAQTDLHSARTQMKTLEDQQNAQHTQIDDLKRKLDKASERLIAETAARSSADANVRELQAEKDKHDAAVRKLEAQAAKWEREYAALKTLYTDTDVTAQTAQAKLTQLERDNEELRTKVEKERRSSKTLGSSGSMLIDDETIDGLEEDGRRRLERRIRELERQLAESQRRPGTAASSASQRQAAGKGRKASVGAGFTEVKFLGNFPNFEDDDDFLPDSDEEQEVTGETPQQARERREAEERWEWEKRENEIKKDLEKWRGFRLDLTQVPGMVGPGGMFEV